MNVRKLTLGIAVFIAVTLSPAAQDSPWGDEPWPPADIGDPGTDSTAESPTDGSAWPTDDGGATSSFGGFDSIGSFQLYGYLSTAVQAMFGAAGSAVEAGEDTAVGSITRLRLKGDWEPDPNVLFHLEIESRYERGVANGYAYTQAMGLGGETVDGVQAANPQDDFRNTLAVDQAWAQLRFDHVDYQIGRVPIAWGTGYAFNPTARTNPAGGLTEIGEEETTGTAAVTAAIALPAGTALEGYVAFEDRLHASATVAEEVEYWNVPWGSRFRGYIGTFDLAFGAIHEVVVARDGSGFDRYLHVTGETVGSLGDLGVYAEARLTSPLYDGKPAEEEQWDPSEALVSTVGLEYVFPGDVEAKVEYYRQGDGATDTDEYDLAPVLSGHVDVMARDYGFVLLQRTFWDYLDLTAAALVNISDGSGAALPGAEYAVSDAISMSATVVVPWGNSDSEFGGAREISAGTVRLVRPTAVVQAKVSF